MASYSSSNVGRHAAPGPAAMTTIGALLGTKDGLFGRKFRLQGGVYGGVKALTPSLNEVLLPDVSFITCPLYSPDTPLCSAFFRGTRVRGMATVSEKGRVPASGSREGVSLAAAAEQAEGVVAEALEQAKEVLSGSSTGEMVAVAPGVGTIHGLLAGGRSTDFATWLLKRAFHFVATITRIALTPPLAEG